MTPTELVAVITAIASILGLFLKMWQDHTRLANKVADGFKENAIAATELKSAVQANTEVGKANARKTDEFTKLLMKIVEPKRKRR